MNSSRGVGAVAGTVLPAAVDKVLNCVIVVVVVVVAVAAVDDDEDIVVVAVVDCLFPIMLGTVL